MMDQNWLVETYRKLADAAVSVGLPKHYAEMTRLYCEKGLWKDYLDILRLARPSFAGCIVVDIGCKYGHVLPLLQAMGADSCIGVDVEDEYLRIGNTAFDAIGFPARLVKSDEAYLPIESDSVDFVLVNEVISHVNPAYLYTLYAEIARILKLGGTVLISDGNNRANAGCVSDLHQLYIAWENGPVGTNTGRDVVDTVYRDFRRDVIAGHNPDLAGDVLDYLADNTSGLFGDRLVIEVGKYLRKEGWVERPYRPGICPTHPGPGGVVMERAFHPIQVELALAEVGIQAIQVYSLMLGSVGSSLRNRLGRLARKIRLAWLQLFAPSALRGRTWAFQIVGNKIEVPPADWKK
jgi:SAM-dependent methyltransferase